MNCYNFYTDPPDEPQEIIVRFKNKAGWQTTAAYWDGNNICTICDEVDFIKIWKIKVKFWMPLPYFDTKKSQKKQQVKNVKVYSFDDAELGF